MTHSETPPAFIPLPRAVLDDDSMPPALLRSFTRLYAAAWRSGYRATPALDFDRQLIPLLGVRRSQAREHLRLLRFARLLDWRSDGANRYVISFPDPAARYAPASESPPAQDWEPPGEESALPESGLAETGLTDCVVGDVDSIRSDSESIHQQQAKAGTPAGKSGENLSGPALASAQAAEQARQQTLRYLLHAGVWEDVSYRLADKIATNVQRTLMQGDQHYLPVTADVLGWMAYCFADRKKNNIASPAAVLAANLNANRRCPEEYRPQPVCALCGLDVDYCDCEAPQEYFPDEFVERAMRGRSPYELDRTWWGVCTRCRGYPCLC